MTEEPCTYPRCQCTEPCADAWRQYEESEGVVFQVELGGLIEKEMAKPSADFGVVLDTLLTNAAMLIAQQSRGDAVLMNKLLEGSSDRLFQMASLFKAGMPKPPERELA